MSERPRLILIPMFDAGEELNAAMAADLEDLLTEYTFEIKRPDSASNDAVLGQLSSNAPTLLIARDMLNPSPAVIESMVEALEVFDIVLCPAFDGSLCAASCYLEGNSAEPCAQALTEAFCNSSTDLGGLTRTLVNFGFHVMVQPPWYRASSGEGALIFALQHMEAMVLTEDEDFVAERTRMVLLKRSK